VVRRLQMGSPLTGEFNYDHHDLWMIRKTSTSFRCVAWLNHSLIAAPSASLLRFHRGICLAWRRGTAVPGKSGGFRGVLGRSRVGYLNPAARARMIAWARSET
jgi:hypothetical protein